MLPPISFHQQVPVSTVCIVPGDGQSYGPFCPLSPHLAAVTIILQAHFSISLTLNPQGKSP